MSVKVRLANSALINRPCPSSHANKAGTRLPEINKQNQLVVRGVARPGKSHVGRGVVENFVVSVSNRPSAR